MSPGQRLLERWPFAMLCLLCACHEASVVPATQVLVQVSAEGSVRARASALRVSFSSGKGDSFSFAEVGSERFELDASFEWPARMLLVPRDGDPERGFRILVEALEGERTFVLARAISKFVGGEAVLLDIVLEDGCIDHLACSEQESCSAAQGLASCTSAVRDADTLPTLTGVPERPPLEDGEPEGGLDGGPRDASQEDAAPVSMPETCGAEDCFNGVDDNCDRKTDCEDPRCQAGASCVNGQEQVWLRLEGEVSCPAGYIAEPGTRHDELLSDACTGCACGAASPTQCTAHVSYDTSCATDGPRFEADLALDQCTSLMSGFIQLTFESVAVTPGTCPPSGKAAPGPLHWGKHATLCRPERSGGGCAASSVCVPKVNAGALCRSTSQAECSSGERREVWYTGYDNDKRSCSACSCVASGAACANLNVGYGYDFSCSDAHLPLAGATACGPNAIGSAAALFGTPQSASCTPRSTLMGQAQPVGGITLCCGP